MIRIRRQSGAEAARAGGIAKKDACMPVQCARTLFLGAGENGEFTRSPVQQVTSSYSVAAGSTSTSTYYKEYLRNKKYRFVALSYF